MTTPLHVLTTNPLSSILSAVKSYHCTTDYGLERTYKISKSNKVLNILREHTPDTQDLRKIAHNVILDLYPEHEYIFGPYTDVNAHEFNLVYFLYSNRINQDNELKILYAGRVLMESLAGVRIGEDPRVLDTHTYLDAVASMQEIPNRKSINCYYRDYTFSEQEMAALKQMYKCKSVCQPRYNVLRENFIVGMSGGDLTGANPLRLIYELHHEKARLPDHKVVTSVNGRKADLRIDNVVCRDLEGEDREKRRVALEEFGLDTYQLEKIMAPTGFNRFRGMYTFDGPDVKPSMKGRRYVKLVVDGTDKQTAHLLSNCLMMVKLGRLLEEDETVDHIDHNHSNDAIDNLRLIGKSEHVSEDSVKVEISPSTCRACGSLFTMNKKAYEYYRHNPYAPTCSPECKKKVGRGAEVGELITHRYYIADKTTGERRYFQSPDYDDCRQQLYQQGRAALLGTPEVTS